MSRRLRGGGNTNRAQAIISQIGKSPEDDNKPELPPVDGIPPNDETPSADTPPEDTPPVDTPPVDTPPEDTPPADDNTPPADTPPEDIPPTDVPPVDEPETPPALAEISDDIILAKLSETLGRTIGSYDDLNPKEIEVDPELKQLIEWKEKTGLSLSQWADYNKDFSKMGDMEVAREILSQKYPTFTKEQLDFELQELVYDEDVDDDRDKMRKSVALTKLATEGRNVLEAKKLELKPTEIAGLTQEQQEAITYANTAKTAEATAVTNQSTYEDNLNLAAQNLDTITLNLDESVVIEHKVDDGEKNGLKDYILNVPHWFNQDGSPNHDSIAKDGYKIKNFDSLLKAAFEQGKSIQKEADIKGKGNVNLDTPGQPQSQGEEKKGNISSVVDKLTGGKNANKFRFRRPKT